MIYKTTNNPPIQLSITRYTQQSNLPIIKKFYISKGDLVFILAKSLYLIVK